MSSNPALDDLLARMERLATTTRATPSATADTCAQMLRVAWPSIRRAEKERTRADVKRVVGEHEGTGCCDPRTLEHVAQSIDAGWHFHGDHLVKGPCRGGAEGDRYPL